MTGGQTSAVTIPSGTRDRFADLIEMIMKSETMSDADRQYWINILPIMSEKQIATLRNILETEKRDLEAIDKKYAKKMTDIGAENMIDDMEEKRRKTRKQRSEAEREFEAQDDKNAQDILGQIENS